MVTMISVAPSNVGFNRTQLQKFFVASSGTFNVMQLSDWYNVTKEQLQTKGMQRIICYLKQNER